MLVARAHTLVCGNRSQVGWRDHFARPSLSGGSGASVEFEFEFEFALEFELGLAGRARGRARKHNGIRLTSAVLGCAMINLQTARFACSSRARARAFDSAALIDCRPVGQPAGRLVARSNQPAVVERNFWRPANRSVSPGGSLSARVISLMPKQDESAVKNCTTFALGERKAVPARPSLDVDVEAGVDVDVDGAQTLVRPARPNGDSAEYLSTMRALAMTNCPAPLLGRPAGRPLSAASWLRCER